MLARGVRVAVMIVSVKDRTGSWGRFVGVLDNDTPQLLTVAHTTDRSFKLEADLGRLELDDLTVEMLMPEGSICGPHGDGYTGRVWLTGDEGCVPAFILRIDHARCPEFWMEVLLPCTVLGV